MTAPEVPRRWSPEAIRQLRGRESRAAFGRRFGVTENTVYRWEVPEGSAGSRRPSGAVLALFDALTGSAPEGAGPARGPAIAEPPASALGASLPPPPSSRAMLATSSPCEGNDVLPSLERILRGDAQRGQAELVRLLGSRPPLSLVSRALAVAGIAAVEVFLRGDAQSALTALAPALADAETALLPAPVAARVLCMAACAHALPDGRFFELGRVNALVEAAVTLAPHDEETAAFAWLASLNAATIAGDQELVSRALSRLEETAMAEPPPLLALHLDEARALRALLYGQAANAVAGFEALASRAEAAGYRLVAARALGYRALRKLEDLAPPDEALGLARKARSLAAASRAAPGVHSVYALRVEAEALFRLGRAQEALAVLDELDALGEEAALPGLPAAATQARILFLTGQREPLRKLAARLSACEVPSLKSIARAYASFAEALLTLDEAPEDGAGARAAFVRAEQESQRWPFLLRDVVVHGVTAALLSMSETEARVALRRAQRFLDTFPSPWAAAHVRRLEGMLLAGYGRWAEGQLLLDAAIATFELAGDRVDAALCRHTLNAFAKSYDLPGAAERFAESAATIAGLGLKAPAALDVGIKAAQALRSKSELGSLEQDSIRIQELVVPLQRLTVKGAPAPLIERELVAVAGAVTRRPCRLEEVDAHGGTRLVCGEASPDEASWVEFGDGSGRGLRLGVPGSLDDDLRAALSCLTTVAGLALEVALYRGFATLGETSPREDTVPDHPEFIAASPAMRRLKADVARLSSSRATVIVTGESGTGKEVVARAVHELSMRAKGPYVAFNCAAVPRDLFEGQLFGYRRGAFTGATSDHLGVIRAAHGGTLFLDEVGELPLDVQPKLLRFLENGEVLPLGEQKPVQVDVRVVAATHRDLGLLVRDGRFREDLYYRLQVIPLRLPPLRERKEDIAPLARHFLRQLGGSEGPVLSADALAALTAHDFPGNVRELRNILERTVAFSPLPPVLTAAHLRM